MVTLPPEDLPFRQWLASRLKRSESTFPGHPLYVPVHEGTLHDPVLRILRDIRLNDTGNTLNFISGFSGSGKSSELLRLKNTLIKEGFFAFVADADEYFMPNGAVDIEVLLIKLAAAYCDQLDKREDIDATKRSYVERFWDWMTQTDVALDGVELNAGASAGDPKVGKVDFGTKLKITLKENPTLIEKVQEARKHKPGVIRAKLTNFFAEITQALREEKPSQLSPVLILDSFEKLSDTSQTKGSVAESISTLLTAHMDEIGVPGHHIVLTMPPWIKLRHLGLDHIHLIFGVKLWTNTAKRSRFEEGYVRMRAVIVKRFTDKGLDRFFGPAGANGERPLLDELIEASGGHLRDLIILLYAVLLEAADGPPPAGQPIANEQNVRAAIANHRSNFSRLSDEAAKCLSEIAKSRSCSFPNHGNEAIQTLTSLFNSHHAFLLPNEEEWCDVHPLALKAIAKKLKRLKTPAKP